MIAYEDFDVLTFDCYGTLIDWESGIVAAARFQLGDAVAAHSDEDLIAAFAAVEHEAARCRTRPTARCSRSRCAAWASGSASP